MGLLWYQIGNPLLIHQHNFQYPEYEANPQN